MNYCKLDCKTLYDILTKFNELIFSEFSINMHSVLTLPSLAMKIFKVHYMPNNTIYQILGQVEKDIRQAYSGGAVDNYKPTNVTDINNPSDLDRRKKLFYYDANSLYPHVMKSMLMPVGKPIAFTGNIRLVDPNAYGFFYCKITSPIDMKHPLLQRRIKTKDGLRTIAGLGSWEGWIFSMEMDLAIKHGYQISILNGYTFKTKILFDGYVDKLYKLRLMHAPPKGQVHQ